VSASKPSHDFATNQHRRPTDLKPMRTRLIDTAVLLLIWNRPALCRRVMDTIRTARPRRLYVAADGPRNEESDRTLCKEARQIATSVDWECGVRTLFRDKNLGCGLAVSSGIDWFFEHEEEGIILEDDCVPTPTFFSYCTELLDHFRNDKRIMCISGNNFQNGNKVITNSYYFSRYTHIWGWATWRRAWKLYDFNIRAWPECRNLLAAWGGGDEGFVEHWQEIFDRVALGEIDTWDYQWALACWMNHGLTCLPAVNLVSNMGFGPTATHTRDVKSCLANIPAQEMTFPLIHPKVIIRDVDADFCQHFKECRRLSRGLSRWERAQRLTLGVLKATLAFPTQVAGLSARVLRLSASDGS
jgi:hypothetical protein